MPNAFVRDVVSWNGWHWAKRQMEDGEPLWNCLYEIIIATSTCCSESPLFTDRVQESLHITIHHSTIPRALQLLRTIFLLQTSYLQLIFQNRKDSKTKRRKLGFAQYTLPYPDCHSNDTHTARFFCINSESSLSRTSGL